MTISVYLLHSCDGCGSTILLRDEMLCYKCKGKNAMDKRVVSKPDVIQASHIIVKNGCMPHRIVIRKVEQRNEFVVHNEYFMTETPTDGTACRFVHHGFENGSYFYFGVTAHLETSEEKALEKAYENYKERVQRLFG